MIPRFLLSSAALTRYGLWHEVKCIYVSERERSESFQQFFIRLRDFAEIHMKAFFLVFSYIPPPPQRWLSLVYIVLVGQAKAKKASKSQRNGAARHIFMVSSYLCLFICLLFYAENIFSLFIALTLLSALWKSCWKHEKSVSSSTSDNDKGHKMLHIFFPSQNVQCYTIFMLIVPVSWAQQRASHAHS